MKKIKRTRRPPEKNNLYYKEMWRVVDAAVANTFDAHPEYIPKNIDKKAIQNSLNKRIVGAILSFAVSKVSHGQSHQSIS